MRSLVPLDGRVWRRIVPVHWRMTWPKPASSPSQILVEYVPLRPRPIGLRRDEMAFVVRGIDTKYVEAIRRGGSDANGQLPVRAVAYGVSNPCRHCLRLIAEDDQKLVLAHRPFDRLQPYAEVGPIFLHADLCERYESDRLPAWFAYLQPAIIRGYDQNDWILYETGNVVPGGELAGVCEEILSNPEVAYVHIRSKYNCFQCRVDRT
jgi:hypothetical protein